MTVPAFAGEQGGVAVDAGGYRFLIPASQVAAVHPGLPVATLPHGPSWLAGMALVGGQLYGVIDWGRFLGVSRRCPGPLIEPLADLGGGWVLQVGSAQAVAGLQWVEADSEMPLSEMADSLMPAWASRPRPDFVVGRAAWIDEAGGAQTADVIDLALLLNHPRLSELAG